MKNWNTFLKVTVIVLLVVVAASGCKKDTNEVSAYYTPEREATISKAWLDSMVANNFDIDTTSTGLLYIPGKVGSGPKVKAGDAVTVKYKGMFLDGTVFDASAYINEAGTLTYLHKAPTDATKTMIQGWEEGIEVLSKGGSAAFLIPSGKAYGSQGKGSKIPPYTPLVFAIEVIDIK